MIANQTEELATVFGRDLAHETACSCNSAIAHHKSDAPRRSECEERAVGPAPKSVGSVVSFVRDRYYLSPARIFRFVWGISTSIPRQIEVIRLMRLPAYAEVLRQDPRFRFKFFIRDYLVRSFSPAQRVACFLHHYKRLQATLSPDLLARTLHQHVPVFAALENDINLQINLCFSRPFEKEGELSLIMKVDGADVFVLSFTIVPGWVIQSDAEEVVLISRLQGTNGYYPQIRAATKAMHNVGPAALLMAALHGIAKAFGIDQMAGVPAERQSSYTEELSRFYINAYDDFFSEIGVIKSPEGYFVGPLPPDDRPIASIKQGHKIRTREKRSFKRHVADEVCCALQSGLRVRIPAVRYEAIRMADIHGPVEQKSA